LVRERLLVHPSPQIAAISANKAEREAGDERYNDDPKGCRRPNCDKLVEAA